MSIWRQDLTPEEMNRRFRDNNMLEFLDIRFLELGADFIRGSMPVDERTRQPMGLLHGGASVVLAETLGSVASHLVVSASEQAPVVGLEISANHLRGIREGLVYGLVKPIHVGRRTHVWDIRLTDDRDRMVCISRLTVMVLDP